MKSLMDILLISFGISVVGMVIRFVRQYKGEIKYVIGKEFKYYIILEFFLYFISLSTFLFITSNYKLSYGLTLLLGILLISIFPTFDYVIRPVLLRLFNNFSVLPENINVWLKNLTDNKISVYVVSTPLYNAFAIGVLPFSRTILIGRPLAEQMSDSELKAVIAHELAHLYLGHVFLRYIISILCVVIFSLVNIKVYKIADAYAMPLNYIIVGVCSAISGVLLLWLIPGYVFRKFEYAADKYAAKMVGNDAVKQALLRLDSLTKGKVSRGGLVHPPLQKRVSCLYD